MAMTENDSALTTIPGWKAHMESAHRILELEQQLKEARAENARLRAGIDDLETVVNHLTPGWWVLTPGNYEACETRADALRLAAEYEGENVALVIRVEERFGAAEEPAPQEDMDAYDGVARGVDYPATLSRGVAARVA